MLFSALLDANVLVPSMLRDTLLRIAERGLYRPLWSADILDETRRAVLRIRPDMDEQRLKKSLDDMNRAFEDAMVSGYQPIIESMTNDPGDHHVLAAAVVGRADAIITCNVKDFHPDSVTPYKIEVQHPDTFLTHQYHLSPPTIIELIHEQSADTRRPHWSAPEILEGLKRAGAVRFVELIEGGN